MMGNAGVELPLSRPQTSFDSRARGYIVFQTGFDVWVILLFFSVSSVSFQALISPSICFDETSNQAKAKNLSKSIYALGGTST